MSSLKKYTIYALVLFALLAVIFIPKVNEALKNQFFPTATIEEAVSIDDSDYDVELKGINVPDTNLKQLKTKKKLLFLNFWGTWCAPCRQEWPSIQKLYETQSDNMEFVLIAMLDKEDAVREFIQKNNYTAPVYLAESPINGKILPKVFPTTFIINSQGRILKKETSAEDWNDKEIHQFIKNVLP